MGQGDFRSLFGDVTVEPTTAGAAAPLSGAESVLRNPQFRSAVEKLSPNRNNAVDLKSIYALRLIFRNRRAKNALAQTRDLQYGEN
jgi:hypothetical protein